MALRTIHIGAVENAFQWDDASTPFYSDGVTPLGLVVPIAPTTDDGVIRKVDLTGAGTIASGDQFILASRIFGG